MTLSIDTGTLLQVRAAGKSTFPWKLHLVLEESERKGFKDIVSWEDEKTFKVHNVNRFETFVMKTYFNNAQYRSFQRQRK